MHHSLLIRPPSILLQSDHSASAAVCWTWLVLDKQGLPVGDMQSGKDLPAAASAILLLPASWLHLRRINMPRMRAAQLLQALPFALEEHIAGDIERMHVIAGKRDGDNELQVAAIESDLLRKILGQLDVSGIKVNSAIPDVLCLQGDALNDDQVNTLWIGDEWLINQSTTTFCLQDEELEWYLQALDAKHSVKLHSVNHIPSDKLEYLQTLLTNNQLVLENARSPLHVLQKGVKTVDVELLQGAFAPGQSQQHALGWRKLAIAASLAILAISAFAITDWWLLSKAKVAAQQMVEDTFREKFPNVTNITNMRVQAEREMGGSSSAQGALALQLIASVAPAISRNNELQLLSIDYERQALRLQMRAASVAQLDQLLEDLQTQQLTVSLDGVSRDAERVRGEVVVEAAR